METFTKHYKRVFYSLHFTTNARFLFYAIQDRTEMENI